MIRKNAAPRQPRRKLDRERVLRLTSISLGLALVLFVAGYLFATRVLFPPLPEPANGIVVPKLIGLTVPQAEAKLVQLGLRLADTTELASPTAPAGVIVAQSPLPGQQLRTAGAVRLGVSSGMPAPPPPPPAAPDTTPKADTTAVDTLPADTLAKDTLPVSATKGTT